MLHEAKIAYYAFDVIQLYIVCTLIRHVLLIRSGHTELLIPSGYAAILFASSIGTAVAKATWRHCLAHFIDRVVARTCCAVNVLTSRISLLFSWPWWMGSVVKHNMLKGVRFCGLQERASKRYTLWRSTQNNFHKLATLFTYSTEEFPSTNPAQGYFSKICYHTSYGHRKAGWSSVTHGLVSLTPRKYANPPSC